MSIRGYRKENCTDARLVLFDLWFRISLVHIIVLLDVGEVVQTECVFGIEWVPVHGVDSVFSLITGLEFDEDIARGNPVRFERTRLKVGSHPLLFFV